MDPQGRAEESVIIHLFLGMDMSENDLDQAAIAKARRLGYIIIVHHAGKWTSNDFRESLADKNAWTFYVGHSVAVSLIFALIDSGGDVGKAVRTGNDAMYWRGREKLTHEELIVWYMSPKARR